VTYQIIIKSLLVISGEIEPSVMLQLFSYCSVAVYHMLMTVTVESTHIML